MERHSTEMMEAPKRLSIDDLPHHLGILGAVQPDMSEQEILGLIDPSIRHLRQKVTINGASLSGAQQASILAALPEKARDHADAEQLENLRTCIIKAPTTIDGVDSFLDSLGLAGAFPIEDETARGQGWDDVRIGRYVAEFEAQFEEPEDGVEQRLEAIIQGQNVRRAWWTPLGAAERASNFITRRALSEASFDSRSQKREDERNAAVYNLLMHNQRPSWWLADAKYLRTHAEQLRQTGASGPRYADFVGANPAVMEHYRRRTRLHRQALGSLGLTLTILFASTFANDHAPKNPSAVAAVTSPESTSTAAAPSTGHESHPKTTAKSQPTLTKATVAPTPTTKPKAAETATTTTAPKPKSKPKPARYIFNEDTYGKIISFTVQPGQGWEEVIAYARQKTGEPYDRETIQTFNNIQVALKAGDRIKVRNCPEGIDPSERPGMLILAGTNEDYVIGEMGKRGVTLTHGQLEILRDAQPFHFYAGNCEPVAPSKNEQAQNAKAAKEKS